MNNQFYILLDFYFYTFIQLKLNYSHRMSFQQWSCRGQRIITFLKPFTDMCQLLPQQCWPVLTQPFHSSCLELVSSVARPGVLFNLHQFVKGNLCLFNFYFFLVKFCIISPANQPLFYIFELSVVLADGLQLHVCLFILL